MVYCGKDEESEDVTCVAQGKAHLAHRTILDLTTDVQRKGTSLI